MILQQQTVDANVNADAVDVADATADADVERLPTSLETETAAVSSGFCCCFPAAAVMTDAATAWDLAEITAAGFFCF